MNNDIVLGVSGLVLYSSDPMRLATFYRALGVPLEAASHGHVGAHLEGMFAGTHIAVWDARHGHRSGELVPTFRTTDLVRAEAVAIERGGRPLHKALDIGEGKRVVTFQDPDGRPLRFIQFDGPIG